MTPIRTILHPTDFSDSSKQAFHLACSLARDHGGQVIVLYVRERPPTAYTAGVAMAPPPPPPSTDERKALQEQLSQIQAPDHAIRVEHLLLEGDPVTAILAIAQERQCDLIAMSTHGRTGLGRLLMGSVAENVLRQATCPVLTVKTPFPDEGSSSPLSKELVSALKTPPA
jgi:nucleotide-binding universal stress UspA family protein